MLDRAFFPAADVAALTDVVDVVSMDQAAWRERWCDREYFVVLQMGFGAGLPLLQSCAALQDDEDGPRCLHFLVIEPRPLTRECLRQLQARWPLLASWADSLCAVWPPLVPGYHRLFLQQGRVALTLIFGAMGDCLPQLEAAVDLFVLHDVRQDEWSRHVSMYLGRLAVAGAELVADRVPLDMVPYLRQAGFSCDGQVGPGLSSTLFYACFAPRWGRVRSRLSVPMARRAIVIGAGLAGSAACERLTARGWELTLIERHATPAQEASGNVAGVYMPVIARDDNPTARLTRLAFLFAQQVWARSGILDGAGVGRGVLQVARDAEQARAFQLAAQHWRYPPDFAEWLDVHEASRRLGMATGGGWFFPRAGWLQPGEVCRAMLAACGERLQRRFGVLAASLRRDDDEWGVCDVRGELIAHAPVVILAGGVTASMLPQAAGLPLGVVRGQVSHVPEAALPALPFALCGDGYVIPAEHGVVSVWASYDRDAGRDLRVASHRGNLDKLEQMLPQLAHDLNPADMTGRVGLRCVSADRLPLVGALPDLSALAMAREVRLPDVPRWSGVYGLLGYASRGLIWAPLAAEIVACQLTGEPAPVGRDLLALLDPARFALKEHRRCSKRGV